MTIVTPTRPVPAERRKKPATRRYSRYVATMKIALPGVALLVIALVVIWPQLGNKGNRFRIGLSGFDAREALDPNMVNARFSGTDGDNNPFSITADLARNLTPDSPVVDLEMPKADITLEDGTWLVITAQTGRYRQKEKRLELQGRVNLFHDMGYEFVTESAHIDLNRGEAVSTQPVRGQGPFGESKSEGFRLKDKGKTIIFTGKSYLLLYPGLEGK